MSESAAVSVAPERAAEPDIWRVLAQSADLAPFARAWLTLAVQSAEGVRRAALLLGPPDRGPFAPVAGFPDEGAAGALTAEAAQPLAAALDKRRPAVESLEGGARIGYPLVFAGVLHGAVLAETRTPDPAAIRRLMRHLQWSAAGIEAFMARDAFRRSALSIDKAQFFVAAIEAMAAEQHGDDCARVFANLLAQKFNCESVAVGRWRAQKIRLVAAAQSASLDRRTEAARQVEAAMEEAVDQEAALLAPRAGAPNAASAQDRLAGARPGRALLTFPLFIRDEALGAVCLSREAAFSQEEVDFVDAFASAAAPMLREKWALDRSLPRLTYERAAALAQKLTGPRHAGLKAASVALVVGALILTFGGDVYRARAKAQIQGETRRVLSAPFDGFVQAQFARAGDVVDEGAVLAQLQDSDLELERLRQIARKRQYQLELDKALAKRDLAEVNIARAQIAQSEAEVDLAEKMLARAKLIAPFRAIVVSGDLSQSVGKPVSRGDNLFELAPLDRYRVTALVTEADVGLARPGQKGELLLSALPDATFPITVDSVATVAQAADGVNGFEVIGAIDSRDPRLRPGMEGVAKIEMGRRNIAWIWTHSLVDWLRIKAWSLIP
ncbi:multidrug resistance efflux pump [Rhodoblastus acidophilus]|uniref:HlyD family efflux transporter periplasmic adaptor subunit n=1 Tax=Rhodoblastus acidophilus TaxID=1074 RepID=UPI002224E9B1|nr:HlyD family efflux transporter periplasmic adaptor subunit [Rhodoblastus acidophilus]MCW2284567.1 multidrug resistance efflux pump [Rhodoblastus acidophilus]MCW2333520.1 multidrug resistance efflux pump [Rhodoblastus acidophilus]